MSRNINVNPGHYKVAGRERQGEAIHQAEQKQAFTTQQAGGPGDGVPPWEATRHTFVSAQPEPEQVEPRASKPRGAKKPSKATKAKAAKKATSKKPSAKRQAARAMPKKSKGATQSRGKTRAGAKMRAAKSSQKTTARRSLRKK